MANPYEDFLGSFTLESPDFKRALKILIKYEIHVLLQRLSDTGEESVVITASIDDRTNGHLGSQKGQSFLREAEIKSFEEQFLSYCSGQAYDRRPHTSEDPGRESARYSEEGQNEEGMRYEEEEEERKRIDLEGNDRAPRHGMEDTRSAKDSSSDSSDQSDDSIFDSNGIHRNNSVTTLLSKLEESRELVRDCYEDKDAVGQCNDVCCRGSYLDLVGPFIRPAIPSLDKSASFSTNKDDDSIIEVDTKLSVRENSVNKVVDLTVNKNTVRNGGVRQNSFQISPKQNNSVITSSNVNSVFQNSPQENHMLKISPNGGDKSCLPQMPLNGQGPFLTPTNGQRLLTIPPDEKNMIQLPRFQQPPVQMPIMGNGIQSTNNDFVYNGERLMDLVSMNKLNNHTETIVSNNQTEIMSKPVNGIDGSQSVLRNQLNCGPVSLQLQAAMANNVSSDSVLKRKLCSRVPECKLRTLLEADSDNMPSFIGEKANGLVKQEPEDSSIQRSVVKGENVVSGTGALEFGKDAMENHLDLVKNEIKQENTDEGVNGDTCRSSTGRSLKFLCRYCGKSLKNKQYRELHEKLHQSQHPYVCETCGSGYDDEKSYEEHSKIHIVHPVLKCETCGYRTSRKFRMNSHREICGKPSKVFMCPYCQKPFLAKRYMKVHMKSHDLSNVHHCPYCVNTYPLKNSLLKHIKTKHRRFDF